MRIGYSVLIPAILALAACGPDTAGPDATNTTGSTKEHARPRVVRSIIGSRDRLRTCRSDRHTMPPRATLTRATPVVCPAGGTGHPVSQRERRGSLRADGNRGVDSRGATVG